MQSQPNQFKDKKPKNGNSNGNISHSAQQEQCPMSVSEDLLPERPFKDLHNPIIKAIWNVDRFNPNINEKLQELHQLVVVNKLNPCVSCDILHDVTGQPIAQATPLLIACFEGDSDVIKFLIENGADANQPESEHHLTALHITCDAEYHGQTLRVSSYFIFISTYSKVFLF
jgi:ankyrin repeat protein